MCRSNIKRGSCYAREAFFGPILGSGLVKILPKSDLDHWRDTYLEAINNLNNTAKSGKIITEFLNNTSDLTEISRVAAVGRG